MYKYKKYFSFVSYIFVNIMIFANLVMSQDIAIELSKLVEGVECISSQPT